MAHSRSGLMEAKTLRLVGEGAVLAAGTEFIRALVSSLAAAIGLAAASRKRMLDWERSIHEASAACKERSSSATCAGSLRVWAISSRSSSR